MRAGLVRRYSKRATSLPVEWTYNYLYNKGIKFYAGVPDSLLKDYCSYVMDHSSAEEHIITPNEGSAIALGIGHYMSRKEIPVVYMQNSGLGNAVNPLTSLADQEVYSIPMMVMIGWRGQPGVPDEPQHIKMGRVTKDLCDLIGLESYVLPSGKDAAKECLDEMIHRMHKESKPLGLLVEKNTFGPYSYQGKSSLSFAMSRESAIKSILAGIDEDDIIVSTTGKASRELYEAREAIQSPQRDFLTVGGMGHASMIALGVARDQTHRRVICIDGDGSILMHMGSLALVGNANAANYVHIIINNGAHESVGGQPTLGHMVDIPGIARCCGYRKTLTVRSEHQLESAIAKLKGTEGPVLIEVLTNTFCRDDLGRPKSSSLENRRAFEAFVKGSAKPQ